MRKNVFFFFFSWLCVSLFAKVMIYVYVRFCTHTQFTKPHTSRTVWYFVSLWFGYNVPSNTSNSASLTPPWHICFYVGSHWPEKKIRLAPKSSTMIYWSLVSFQCAVFRTLNRKQCSTQSEWPILILDLHVIEHNINWTARTIEGITMNEFPKISHNHGNNRRCDTTT